MIFSFLVHSYHFALYPYISSSVEAVSEVFFWWRLFVRLFVCLFVGNITGKRLELSSSTFSADG